MLSSSEYWSVKCLQATLSAKLDGMALEDARADLWVLVESIVAMRPVVEATLRYHAEIDHEASRSRGEVFTCEMSLLDAVDTYRRATNE